MRVLKKTIFSEHFEFKHILIIFFVIVLFQFMFFIIFKYTLKDIVKKTQKWYQKNYAEVLGSISTNTFEIVIEIQNLLKENKIKASNIVSAYNIIFSQQLLQENINDVCIFLFKNEKNLIFDNGRQMYLYFFEDKYIKPEKKHDVAVSYLEKIFDEIREKEHVFSFVSDDNIFYLFVPLVPHGEFIGVVFFKIKIELSYLSDNIVQSYNEISLIFSALMFVGLLGMLLISSYTLNERNDALEMYYKEKEKFISEQIEHKKEVQFTRKIYHTTHKAEKILGFMLEDLNEINCDNFEVYKERLKRYTKFVSRVFYDMKWLDIPVNSVRNIIFNTNINKIIEFIVKNIFKRVTYGKTYFDIVLKLDSKLPNVHINEYAIWEILEPLIQNSIDHSCKDNIIIEIQTEYDKDNKLGKIIISDNGRGIKEDLLEEENGVQKIFKEQISTKKHIDNSGYGCFIAYEIAVKKCGWRMRAGNNPEGGAFFEIVFKV